MKLDRLQNKLPNSCSATYAHMPYISSIVATVLALFLGFVISMSLVEKHLFWSLFTIIYGIIVVGAGWTYAISRDRAVAWIHSLLMFGMAGVCGVYGFFILRDQSIAGGRGPDANPNAGIIYGVGFLAILIALATAALGLGVIIHVLRNHKNTRPVA